MLILPGSVLLGLVLIGLAIFWISKLPPKAPNFKKSSSEIYSYEAKNKNFQTSLGLKDQSPIISFGTSENHLVTLLYQTDQQTNPQLNASGKNLTYTEIEPGIDLKYQTLANGIKEEIILNQARQKEANIGIFLFDANLQGAYLKESVKGLATPIFYDEFDNYLFHFEKPFAIDAAGNRTDNVSLQIEDKANSKITSVRRDTNSETPYLVRMTVDENWLNDPARVYPITIDPTIVHDESSEFSPGQLNRVKDTGSGSSPVLESYYQELTADEYTVGLWHMNEASGNVLDSSGNSNTGTPTGTTVVAGLLNNARSFNGSSDNISVSTFGFDYDNLTIEAWVKTNLLSSRTTIIDLGDETSLIPQLEIGTCNGGTNAVCVITPGVWQAQTVNNVISVGNWTHIVYTKNGAGSTHHIYVNGVEQALATNASADYSTASSSKIIGSRGGTAQFFNGQIDEIRISNIARSPEEIKTAASRRPYSTYTSDVIDLTDSKIWNDLSWLTNGVATGDGETATASAQSALVAQWNFNETSGTTAASEGSCGASCNGTLTSFASTASQDQAAGTGWTANNKRWGVGALMFDGTDDYVSIANTSTLNPSTITIETWFKGSAINGTNSNYILGKYNTTSPWQGYGIRAHDNLFKCWVGGSAWTAGTTNIVDDRWHYGVCTYDGTNTKVYVDGKLEATQAQTATLAHTSNLTIGSYNSPSNNWNGVIDSVRIYSRALTASEILSNYNSSSVEFQTRVGATADANDGTWEAWRPSSTVETIIDSMDGNTEYNYNTKLLMHFNGTDASTTFTDHSLVPKTITPSGNVQIDTAQSKFGGSSALFDGTGDYLTIPDSNDFAFGSEDFTIDFWMRLNALPASGSYTFYSQFADDLNFSRIALWNNGSSQYAIQFQEYIAGSSTAASFMSTYDNSWQANTWYHIALVRSGNSWNIYRDGTSIASKTDSTTLTN